MVFTFPQNAHDFLVMFVPFVTVLVGLVFFLFPRRLLYYMGLEAVPGRPEAIGEGRSSFAGAIRAVGIGCLVLQDPIALQPGLNLTLAVAWTVAACGRVIQLAFDGGLKRKRIQTRFLIAAGLAILAWNVTEIPYFACTGSAGLQCYLPDTLRGWVLFAVAAFTFLLGFIAFVMPVIALKILKLQTRVHMPFAIGETRGMLAGFYLAIGGVFLLQPQPADFVALLLGAAWILTGIGRLLSIPLDRGWTFYNFAGVGLELGIGFAVLAIVLRIF